MQMHVSELQSSIFRLNVICHGASKSSADDNDELCFSSLMKKRGMLFVVSEIQMKKGKTSN